MPNPAPTPPRPANPLSPETERQLTRTFALADHDAIRAILLDYGTHSWHREVERVRFDILYLANGDLAKARRFTDTAMRDYRDILIAEYLPIDGQLVPRTWTKAPPANREPRKPPTPSKLP